MTIPKILQDLHKHNRKKRKLPKTSTTKIDNLMQCVRSQEWWPSWGQKRQEVGLG